jgi:hypothetical protein
MISCLFLTIGLAACLAHGFHIPSNNVERLTTQVQSKQVDLDLCPLCINEAVQAINILLNLVVDEGIMGSCNKLCGALANKTGSAFAGEICTAVCDGLGIDEFIHEIVNVDIDPIWYCEIADLCPSK